MPWAFLAPYLIVFLLFMLLPAVAGAFTSFTNWKIVGDPEWVGLRNYRNLINNDPEFVRAFKNTLRFTAYTVPPLVIGGLLLALLFNQPLKGRIVGRTIAFVPFAIMVTVVGILWRWIYDRNFGLANYYLDHYGIIDLLNHLGLSDDLLIRKDKIPWITKPKWVLISVAMTTIWWQIGTNMIIYLAGLQEIPHELYEASKIDGANARQRFWYITIPGLKLMHMFVIPMSIISSLRVFGQVQVMTQGGPAGSSYTVVQHIYATGLTGSLRMGYGAAVGVILFAITFGFTLLQLQAWTRSEHVRPRYVLTGPVSRIARLRQFIYAALMLPFRIIGFLWGLLDLIPLGLKYVWKQAGSIPWLRRAQQVLTGIGQTLYFVLNRVHRWKIIPYTLLIIVTIFFIVPTAWMFSTATKPESRVRELPIKWITSDISLRNFEMALHDYPIEKWFVTSTNVAVTTTVLGLVIYSLAAYPLARMNFRGKQLLYIGILATMLIPVEATMVPLFLGLSRLDLDGTEFSLIMPVVANAFGLYLLVQFFQTIPVDLEDAARIDGCSEIGVYWRIILPLARPALATAGIFTFMASWNNYVWPLVVSDLDTTTLPVGLAQTFGAITGSPTSVKYGLVMAGMTLATLPPILVFIALQRYFVQGISMTGIKG